jgi:hypothetical protein
VAKTGKINEPIIKKTVIRRNKVIIVEKRWFILTLLTSKFFMGLPISETTIDKEIYPISGFEIIIKLNNAIKPAIIKKDFTIE